MDESFIPAVTALFSGVATLLCLIIGWIVNQQITRINKMDAHLNTLTTQLATIVENSRHDAARLQRIDVIEDKLVVLTSQLSSLSEIHKLDRQWIRDNDAKLDAVVADIKEITTIILRLVPPSGDAG